MEGNTVIGWVQAFRAEASVGISPCTQDLGIRVPSALCSKRCCRTEGVGTLLGETVLTCTKGLNSTLLLTGFGKTPPPSAVLLAAVPTADHGRATELVLASPKLEGGSLVRFYFFS